MHSALIVFPQNSELKAFMVGLRKNGFTGTSRRAGRVEIKSVSSLGLMIAVGGHGKAQFALQTQYLINHLPRTRMVVCAGASGRLSKDLHLGDVVVGTQTVEHDYRLRFIQRPLPIFKADSAALSGFRNATRDLQFRVHFGPIASGDEDVIDPLRAKEIRAATGGLCVAWEGGGGARAAAFNKLPFIEIRAITDGADDHAARDFQTNLAKVMPNISSLLINWRKIIV